MDAGGVQSFCILEGTTDPLIEQWQKFLGQLGPDIRWKILSQYLERFQIYGYLTEKFWQVPAYDRIQVMNI